VKDEAVVTSIDYTKIPAQMEKKFEALDEDSALRPTIIKPGDSWTKKVPTYRTKETQHSLN